MDEKDYFQEDLDRAVDKWRGQSRKGFLELCILLSVQLNKRIFGYAIMENLQSLGFDMSEGSLYPLLARLVKERTLEACWETPVEGHPRKYYTLSRFGQDFLRQIEHAYETDHHAFLNLKDERSRT
ncbi:MAG: PadR family transcriptional regulator [Spirochaetota bacterium]